MSPKSLLTITIVFGFILIISSTCSGPVDKTTPEKPSIIKLGTLDCDMVETSPVVFRNKLYRFEYVRQNYKPNSTGDSYFRFIDVENGKPTPGFAAGYHLGSAYNDKDIMYVYGVNLWGESNIQVFWSDNLEMWSTKSALNLPGWGIYNSSVCRGKDNYIMAFEIGEPPEETGVRFTTRFAESSDLRNWTLLPSEYIYTKERYSACPDIHYLGGVYYMIYLEAKPGPTYESHIVRSNNLIDWESSPLNPVLRHSPEDKIIGNDDLSPAQKERIANAKNLNNSDVGLCEFNGKVIIYYSWGNQQGVEHLAHAMYEGTLNNLLTGFFPE